MNTEQWLTVIQENGFLILQLGILVMLFYYIYSRFIRKSQAERLFKGLFVVLSILIALWVIALTLQATVLEGVLRITAQLLVIALIVIFQPELRRILLYFGQSDLFGKQGLGMGSEERKPEYLVQQLTDAVRFLSKSKTGALIVLESPSSQGADYLEMGTPIDARLSTEMLLTVFHPKTPLHDGAVIINDNNRIVAAGVLLPLTEDPKLSWQYGTRHRAAIGLTEISDSRCIVVSEETGNISLVDRGKLEKLANADELKKRLERIYDVSTSAQKKVRNIFGERLSGLFTGEVLPDRLQKIFTRREENDWGSEKKSAASKSSPKSGPKQ